MAVTPKTLAVAAAAQTLEERCNRFTLMNSNAPARVQERELNIILDGVRDLVNAIGEDQPFVPLGTFMVDENGLRATEPGTARAVQHVIYRPVTKTLGVYMTSRPRRLPDGRLVAFAPLPPTDEAGNDLTRVISYSDMIEMGYTPNEVVAFLSKLAGMVSFDFYSKMATSHVVGSA
jgi:hypothetical protein